MKLIYALTVAMCCTTGANAGDKCNPDYLVTNAIFTHGSMVCDDAWLDRKASLIAANLAKYCSHMSDAEMMKRLSEGIGKFDNTVKSIGHDAACKKLDSAMKAFGD